MLASARSAIYRMLMSARSLYRKPYAKSLVLYTECYRMAECSFFKPNATEGHRTLPSATECSYRISKDIVNKNFRVLFIKWPCDVLADSKKVQVPNMLL